MTDEDVEKRVETAFRALLEKRPYAEITVSDICRDAGIARKTFYAHYDNKEDIIARVFANEVIGPQRELHKLLPKEVRSDNAPVFNKKFYDSFLEDRDFWYRIVGPLRGIDDTFIRVVTRGLYEFNIQILSENLATTEDWETDYAAYFISSSQAMFTQKWISEGMKIPTEKLAALYRRLAVAFWMV